MLSASTFHYWLREKVLIVTAWNNVEIKNPQSLSLKSMLQIFMNYLAQIYDGIAYNTICTKDWGLDDQYLIPMLVAVGEDLILLNCVYDTEYVCYTNELYVKSRSALEISINSILVTSWITYCTSSTCTNTQ